MKGLSAPHSSTACNPSLFGFQLQSVHCQIYSQLSTPFYPQLAILNDQLQSFDLLCPLLPIVPNNLGPPQPSLDQDQTLCCQYQPMPPPCLPEMLDLTAEVVFLLDLLCYFLPSLLETFCCSLRLFSSAGFLPTCRQLAPPQIASQ